jgi:hypothetical protein
MIGPISPNKIIIRLSSLQDAGRHDVPQNKTVLAVLGEEEEGEENDDENGPMLRPSSLQSTLITDDSSSMSLPSSPPSDYDPVLSPLPFLSQVSAHRSPVFKSPVSFPLAPETTTITRSSSSTTINLISVDDGDGGDATAVLHRHPFSPPARQPPLPQQ